MMVSPFRLLLIPLGRMGDPGRRGLFLSPPARGPYDRLKWWTVRHELRQRLEPYQVSEVARPFRRMSWNDLRYWALLIDEDDAGMARLVAPWWCEVHEAKEFETGKRPSSGFCWSAYQTEGISGECRMVPDSPLPTPEEWFGKVEV